MLPYFRNRSNRRRNKLSHGAAANTGRNYADSTESCLLVAAPKHDGFAVVVDHGTQIQTIVGITDPMHKRPWLAHRKT